MSSSVNHYDTISTLHAKLITTLHKVSTDDTLYECNIPSSYYDTSPGSLLQLADANLRVFPFSSVQLCWRRAYEEASLWSVVKVLEGALNHSSDADSTDASEFHAEWTDGIELKEGDWVDEVVRLCDMALIMTGAPGRKKTTHWVLGELEKLLVTPGKSAVSTTYEDQEEARPRKRMKMTLPPPKHLDTPSHGGNHGIDDTKPQDQASVLPKQSKKSSVDTSSKDEKRDRTEHAVLEQQSSSAMRELKRRNTHTNPTPAIPSSFPPRSASIPLIQYPISRLSSPSLEAFHTHMHSTRTPLIITNSINHWPAIEAGRWQDPRYWMQKTLGGRRRVPIELGRSYVDEGWGQKIVRFGEFVGAMLGMDVDFTGEEEDAPKRPRGNVYLAQHDLLTQIPALRNDIAIPDYCYLAPPREVASTITSMTPSTTEHEEPYSTEQVEDTTNQDTSTPLLNIWLGPASTISPCHTDPHHNILAQVFGRKYVRLYAPEEETVNGNMYPMGKDSSNQKGGREDDAVEEKHEIPTKDIDMSNTSQVDVSAFLEYPSSSDDCSSMRRPEYTADAKQDGLKAQQLKQFPKFTEAKYVETILGPGECLYIPKGWWHYVRSLECSCSVSFWWD